MNDTLRRALADAEISADQVAKKLDVDPKTVRRWIAGRIPYPGNRARLAGLVGRDIRELWPDPMSRTRLSGPPSPEILATYPHRWAVPREAWGQLFGSASREIGVLAYAGLFLAEDVGLLRTLAEKARDGVVVRILLGDPESPHVAKRGTDEGIGDTLAARIRNALVLYRNLRDQDGVEVRLHCTTLYTSIYRADDQLLINPHIYGVPASHAPVLHLRRASDGDMASTYLDSFEQVWESASLLT